MRTYFKQFRHLILGLATCLAILGLCTPGLSGWLGAGAAQASEPSIAVSSEFSLIASAQTNIKAAESKLLAQGRMQPYTTYVAIMSEDNVVGSDPKTRARGTVGAVISGNRLVTRGSFNILSSPMRDYASDPVNPPNTDITSAFHIHQGTPMENGPFQYALDVMMGGTARSGSAMGEYMLSQEQMQALADGRLYVDIHTTKNRGGELRGTLMPYSASR